jgi:hypothetical protein
MNPPNKTRVEYHRLQAIRDWNRRFKAPPVPSEAWTIDDWAKWEKSREPLPPFKQWAKQPEP